MKLTTVRFGEIDIDESRIFDFVLPLIGFDMLKKFVILEPNKETLFKWLQSVEDPGLAFPIISVSNLNFDYTIVFNIDTQTAGQVVLSGSGYDISYPMFKNN